MKPPTQFLSLQTLVELGVEPEEIAQHRTLMLADVERDFKAWWSSSSTSSGDGGSVTNVQAQASLLDGIMQTLWFLEPSANDNSMFREYVSHLYNGGAPVVGIDRQLHALITDALEKLKSPE